VTAWRVVLGVVIGLVVGKPVGVLLAIALTLGLRLGALPKGITFRHLLVLGAVAGVGFTMSLFVAQLAFIEPRLLSAAKVGVLAASALAAIAALGLGRLTLTTECAKQAVQSADDAEAVTKP
jgi:NhaA family Na+:H+ antiporter